MSKRKTETGFGDDIDAMLEDSDDERAGEMVGGAESEDDEMVGAQASMSAHEENEDEDAMDEEKYEVEYGENGEMTGGPDQRSESPHTLDEHGQMNLEWPTQVPTQKDAVEPSNKMKKLALKRAREKVKRAKSMFMLFSIDAGAKLEKGLSMKERAPIIKEGYKEMLETPAAKEEWTAKAQADRDRFDRELADALEHELAVLMREGMPEESNAGATLAQLGQNTELIFPLARVRKVVKMDPAVKNVSKDGVVAITKATELFVAYMGLKCQSIAALRGGKNVQERDFIHLVSTNKDLEFLREDFPRREADFGSKKKAAAGSTANGEGEGTALDGAEGNVGGASARKKKSKLQDAAEGSASLGAFFTKNAPGEMSIPAALPTRHVRAKTGAASAGSPIKDALGGPPSVEEKRVTPSGKGKGKRGSKKGKGGSTRVADNEKETGHEHMSHSEEDAEAGEKAEIDTDAVSEAKLREEAPERPRRAPKQSSSKSRAKGDKSNSLLDMFGAKPASGSGARPVRRDIEDLI
jgi:hypothetical protein